MRLEGSNSGRCSAKRLRRQMTPPELALWSALRRNDERFRFRRQHPASDYVLDFYCAPAMLAIEVDGEAHERGNRPERDAKRDAWLAERGVRVVRYAARDVLANLEGVVTQIMKVALERRASIDAVGHPPPPSPSVPPPPGGGG